MLIRPVARLRYPQLLTYSLNIPAVAPLIQSEVFADKNLEIFLGLGLLLFGRTIRHVQMRVQFAFIPANPRAYFADPQELLAPTQSRTPDCILRFYAFL